MGLTALDIEICVGAIPGTWADGAACHGADPEIFFPQKGHSYGAARRTCATCPVVDECRSYADRIERQTKPAAWFGMYAGESPSERYLRRRGRSWRPSLDLTR